MTEAHSLLRRPRDKKEKSKKKKKEESESKTEILVKKTMPNNKRGGQQFAISTRTFLSQTTQEEDKEMLETNYNDFLTSELRWRQQRKRQDEAGRSMTAAVAAVGRLFIGEGALVSESLIKSMRQANRLLVVCAIFLLIGSLAFQLPHEVGAKIHHSKRQVSSLDSSSNSLSSQQVAPNQGSSSTSAGRENTNWWNLWWQQYISEATQPTVRPIVGVSFNGQTINGQSSSEQGNQDLESSRNELERDSLESVGSSASSFNYLNNREPASSNKEAQQNELERDSLQLPNNMHPATREQISAKQQQANNNNNNWQMVKPTIMRSLAARSNRQVAPSSGQQVNLPASGATSGEQRLLSASSSFEEPTAGELGIQMRAAMNRNGISRQQQATMKPLGSRMLLQQQQQLLQQQQQQSIDEMRFEQQQQTQMLDYDEPSSSTGEELDGPSVTGSVNQGSGSANSDSASMMAGGQQQQPTQSTQAQTAPPTERQRNNNNNNRQPPSTTLISGAGDNVNQLPAAPLEGSAQSEEGARQVNGGTTGTTIKPSATNKGRAMNAAAGQQQQANMVVSSSAKGFNANQPNESVGARGEESGGAILVGEFESNKQQINSTTTSTMAPPSTQNGDRTNFNMPTGGGGNQEETNETPISISGDNISGGSANENGQDRPAQATSTTSISLPTTTPTPTPVRQTLSSSTTPFSGAGGRVELMNGRPSGNMRTTNPVRLPNQSKSTTNTLGSTKSSASTGSESVTPPSRINTTSRPADQQDGERIPVSAGGFSREDKPTTSSSPATTTTRRPSEIFTTTPPSSSFTPTRGGNNQSETNGQNVTSIAGTVIITNANNTTEINTEDSTGTEEPNGDDEDSTTEVGGTNLMNSAGDSNDSDDSGDEDSTDAPESGTTLPTSGDRQEQTTTTSTAAPSIEGDRKETSMSQEQQSMTPGGSTSTTIQPPAFTTIDIERLPSKSGAQLQSSTITPISIMSMMRTNEKAAILESGDIPRIQQPSQQQQFAPASVSLDSNGGSKRLEGQLVGNTAITMPMETLMKMMMMNSQQQQSFLEQTTTTTQMTPVLSGNNDTETQTNEAPTRRPDQTGSQSTQTQTTTAAPSASSTTTPAGRQQVSTGLGKSESGKKASDDELSAAMVMMMNSLPAQDDESGATALTSGASQASTTNGQQQVGKKMKMLQPPPPTTRQPTISTSRQQPQSTADSSNMMMMMGAVSNGDNNRQSETQKSQMVNLEPSAPSSGNSETGMAAGGDDSKVELLNLDIMPIQRMMNQQQQQQQQQQLQLQKEKEKLQQQKETPKSSNQKQATGMMQDQVLMVMDVEPGMRLRPPPSGGQQMKIMTGQPNSLGSVSLGGNDGSKTMYVVLGQMPQNMMMTQTKAHAKKPAPTAQPSTKQQQQQQQQRASSIRPPNSPASIMLMQQQQKQQQQQQQTTTTSKMPNQINIQSTSSERMTTNLMNQDQRTAQQVAGMTTTQQQQQQPRNTTPQTMANTKITSSKLSSAQQQTTPASIFSSTATTTTTNRPRTSPTEGATNTVMMSQRNSLDGSVIMRGPSMDELNVQTSSKSPTQTEQQSRKQEQVSLSPSTTQMPMTLSPSTSSSTSSSSSTNSAAKQNIIEQSSSTTMSPSFIATSSLPTTTTRLPQTSLSSSSQSGKTSQVVGTNRTGAPSGEQRQQVPTTLSPLITTTTTTTQVPSNKTEKNDRLVDGDENVSKNSLDSTGANINNIKKQSTLSTPTSGAEKRPASKGPQKISIGKSANQTSNSFIPSKLRNDFTRFNSRLQQLTGNSSGLLQPEQAPAGTPTTTQTPITLNQQQQNLASSIRQFGGANRMSAMAQQPVPFGRPAAMTMQRSGMLQQQPQSSGNRAGAFGQQKFELPVFEYGASIAVRRPDEPLANGQVPNCTLTGKNFCVLTKDYPMNEVRQAVERSFRSVRIMYEELQTVSDQELHKEDFKINGTNNQAASGKFACQTQVEMMRPGWAKDEITKEWMLVVNTDVFPQRVRTESCAQPNTPCEFIAPFYDSTCQQRYSLHRMIAIDPHDPSRSPQVAVFKFPAGCVCRVHPIRKTTTSSTSTTTISSSQQTTSAPAVTMISSSTSKSIVGKRRR